MIANKLKTNLFSNLLQTDKNILMNWMNHLRSRMNINMNKNNFANKEKNDCSSWIMKFYIENKKSFPHVMFFALAKLWREMSIFLTSTFKRKKLKMKKHKCAKRIKKLRNIQKSNLRKK